jgi:uncharacterized tellurite resistance protein B-like protein
MKFADISLASNISGLPVMSHQALLKPGDISPLSAYHTLKELFGSPNSEWFDEGKSQWAYYLRVPGAYLDVYDWKLYSWSIAVYEDSALENAKQEYSSNDDQGAPNQEIVSSISKAFEKGDKRKAEKIGNEFLSFLRKHIPKSNSKIKKAEAEATKFVLQNPFTLYYQSAASLLERASDPVISTSDYYRSAFFLFIAAFEGLLNLIYELYLKVDLRDGRIYDRLSREQIDIKVRLAPLYCDCFSGKSFDHTSEVFKQFHSIVNLRNDFIHANLTKPMKRAIVIEDGHIFIVEQSSRDKNGLPKSIDTLTEEDLKLIKDNINQMIDMLAEIMKPRFRREFRSILEEDYIQIIIEEGEIIVVEPRL